MRSLYTGTANIKQSVLLLAPKFNIISYQIPFFFVFVFLHKIVWVKELWPRKKEN